MVSITSSLIPLKQTEVCGTTSTITLPDSGITLSSPSLSSNILYPQKAVSSGTVPLGGGAILKFSVADFGIDTSLSSNTDNQNIFIELDKLIAAEFVNVISSPRLIDIRLAVNKTILSLTRSKKTKNYANIPTVYISTFSGDDSQLKSNVANSAVVKVAELAFIPPEILESLANVVSSKYDQDSSVVGISGSTLFDLNQTANLDESRILQWIMEFFPVHNVSENELTKKFGLPPIYGYYTVFNDFLYVKLPNLTGEDSAGFSSGFYAEDEERSVFLELNKDGTLTRLKIDSYLAPPVYTVVGVEDGDFPTFGQTVEITISGEGDIEKAYLSLIDQDSKSVVSSSGLKTFDSGIEMFTVPNLTASVISSQDSANFLSSDLKPTLSSDFKISSTTKDSLAKHFNNLVSVEDLTTHYFSVTIDGDVIDLPVGSQNSSNSSGSGYDPEIILGEKNRPELVLSDRDDGKAAGNKHNNSKFVNPNLSASRALLVSNRPRVYNDDQIPKQWIKNTGDIPKINDDERTIKFSGSDFGIINTLNLGNPEFVLYLQDKAGHIVRVPGPNVVLELSIPTIDTIKPNGFFGSSGRILATDIPILELNGDDLDNVSQININLAGSSISTLSLPSGESAEANVVISADGTKVTISFHDTLSNLGLSGDQSYDVTAINSNSDSSQPVQIFISVSNSDPETLPSAPSNIPNIEIGEFFAPDFPGNIITNIPVLNDGQSAQIKLKSKNKLFKDDNNIFAYLAFLPDDLNVVRKFDFQENIVTIKSAAISSSESKDIIIPKTIQYELGSSLIGDFVRLSNKKALLNFPGSQLKGRNFSDLPSLSQAFLFITAQSITDLVGSSTSTTLPEGTYGIISLGDGEVVYPKPFINPPIITDIIASVGTTKIKNSSSPSSTNQEFTQALETAFGGSLSDAEPGKVNAYNKIAKLVLVFDGQELSKQRKNYKITLGETNLKKNISKEFTRIASTNQMLAVLENITSSQDGLLELKVEKIDKQFGVTYDSSAAARKLTVQALSDIFKIDSKTGILTISSEIKDLIAKESETEFTNGFLLNNESASTPAEIIEELIPFSGSGFPIISTSGKPYQFSNDINLTPNIDIKFGDDSKIIGGTKSDDLSTLDTSSIEIPNSTIVSPNDYVESPSGLGAKISLSVAPSNISAIGFRIPEITKITTKKNKIIFPAGETDKVELIAGESITLEVKNVKNDFSVRFSGKNKFNIPVEATSIARNIQANGSEGVFTADVLVPSTLTGIVLSAEICASNTNSDRLRAQGILGVDFVNNIDDQFKNLLGGKLADKIPDVQGLLEQLANAPLKLVNVTLDKVSIPTELINTFCDLSFHLTADLQIGLKGFQILLVPIQVIFCIIDVICALLNPIKLARAVIRLFECLYDLLLLLPQISIPVMLIKLLLHLLELLECLIQKILYTITAINAIIVAINNAIEQKNFAALVALEEVLSEYLFEIDADLQVLEPIISILAIFLQLLQIVFRFPCNVNPGGTGDQTCGLDGSLLAGIIAGLVSPEDNVIDPAVLIPVVQPITTEEIDDAGSDGSSIVSPNDGDTVAIRTTESTFVDEFATDDETLRTQDSDAEFNATFSTSFTKSKKKGGKNLQVRFEFKSRGESSFFLKKIFDPGQTLDAPITLLEIDDNTLKVRESGNYGNFISPIDDYEFMTVEDGLGTIKPLQLEFDVDITETNPDTGEVEVTGTQTVIRTFDEIPSMVILDEEFNLYFIDSEGIIFDNDFNISEIRATLVSNISAPKFKTSVEEEDVDDNDDGVIDESDSGDTVKVHDFPQLYFADLRQASDEIASVCNTSSINSFLLEVAGTTDFNLEEAAGLEAGSLDPGAGSGGNDTAAIAEIVDNASQCIQTFLTEVRAQTSAAKTSLANGIVPDLLDLNAFNQSSDTIRACVNDSIDDICIFVVNSLNTSLKVQEDNQSSDVIGFPDLELSPELLDGFVTNGPSLTGAREYAAGIGDSATVAINSTATLELIPRDSYDEVVPGDLSNKIIFEIVSDSTKTAKFVNSSGSATPSPEVSLVNGAYTTKITASAVGEVKIRAKVCNKTIQAVTFANVGLTDLGISSQEEVDCVEDTELVATTTSAPLGALTKIDRIITIFFVKSASIMTTKDIEDDARIAHTTPQTFGTKLEN